MPKMLVVPIYVRSFSSEEKVLHRVDPLELNYRTNMTDPYELKPAVDLTSTAPRPAQLYDRTTLELRDRSSKKDDPRFSLEKIHLHFVLPEPLRTSSPMIPKSVLAIDGIKLKDSLTAADMAEMQKQAFPCVPNRWRVARHIGTAKTWIIESDRLSTDSADCRRLYPVPGKDPLYLGCLTDLGATKLDAFLDSRRNLPHVERLTAEGYGDPWFASEYGSCRHVFGFGDPDYPITNPMPYEVIGWYDSAADDPLRQFMAAMRRYTNIDDIGAEKTATEKEALKEAAWAAAIQARFRWSAGSGHLEGMTCVASILVRSTSGDRDAGLPSGLAKCGVASTGVEALSKYLSKHEEITISTWLGTEEVEEIFEVLALDDVPNFENLDLLFRLRELRHDKEYRPQDGGWLWAVVSEGRKPDAEDAEEITLPAEVAHQLHELNLAQQNYDKAKDEIDSLRQELVCLSRSLLRVHGLPGPRDVRGNPDNYDSHVKEQLTIVLTALEAKISAVGELALAMNAEKSWSAKDSVSGDASNPTLAASVASKLKSVQDSLGQVLPATNVDLGKVPYYAPQDASLPEKDRLVLQVKPGPRYYSPTNPVVLLNAPNVDLDGGVAMLTLPLPACVAVDATLSSTFPTFSNVLNPAPSLINFHPIYMEWSAVSKPAFEGDAVQQMVNWNKLDVDLKIDNVELETADALPELKSRLLYGRSPLSDHASAVLRSRIWKYLKRRFDRVDGLKGLSEEPNYDNDTSAVFRLATEKLPMKSPERACIAAYNKLEIDASVSNQRAHITFALNGYNNTMLSMERGFQYPLNHKDSLTAIDPNLAPKIIEALGDGDYHVGPNVDPARGSGVTRNMPFDPIRSGKLTLQALRLVDSFGRCVDYRDADNQPALHAPYRLDPRIVPACRINARWLSAANGYQEMNSHPATSPICGWVVPNLLDEALAIYASSGDYLGYIDKKGLWRSRPGGGGAITMGDITDPHLRKMVTHLCRCPEDIADGATFISDFMGTLVTALENIDPEGYRQHQAQALLMGRPLALVRMAVGLSLKGLPPLDNRDGSLREQLNITNPGGLMTAAIPVRVGEHMHINDSVVGFWVEKDAGYEGKFYAPQSAYLGEDKFIEGPDQATYTFDCAIGDDPTTLSILFDPRGLLHVTTGILPTKTLSIPTDQYTEALRRIAITFLTAPLLVPVNRTQIALPQEPGLAWSWVQLDDGAWEHVRNEPTILLDDFLQEFTSEGPAFWDDLVNASWLKPLSANEYAGAAAIVAPAQERKTLLAATQAKRAVVEQVLATKSKLLEPPSRSAQNTDRHELREGWMRLAMQPGSVKPTVIGS